jgi:hypothetical protein
MVEKSKRKVGVPPIAEENELLCGESFLQAPWNMFLANDFRTAQTALNSGPSKEMTADDWEELRRRVWQRHAESEGK